MAEKKNALQELIAQYNAGKGGPSGQTLLSVLSQQQDPRAQHWMQMEMQRQRDANGGGVLPQELAGMNVPMATQVVFPRQRAMTVQALPMAPGEYEAWQQKQAQDELLSRSRMSPLGRAQGMKNASDNLQMMWDKQRINNAVMPAEVGSPGMGGRLYDLFMASIGRKPAL
jgi:hypothetical protein